MGRRREGDPTISPLEQAIWIAMLLAIYAACGFGIVLSYGRLMRWMAAQ